MSASRASLSSNWRAGIGQSTPSPRPTLANIQIGQILYLPHRCTTFQNVVSGSLYDHPCVVKAIDPVTGIITVQNVTTFGGKSLRDKWSASTTNREMMWFMSIEHPTSGQEHNSPCWPTLALRTGDLHLKKPSYVNCLNDYLVDIQGLEYAVGQKGSLKNTVLARASLEALQRWRPHTQDESACPSLWTLPSGVPTRLGQTEASTPAPRQNLSRPLIPAQRCVRSWEVSASARRIANCHRPGPPPLANLALADQLPGPQAGVLRSPDSLRSGDYMPPRTALVDHCQE